MATFETVVDREEDLTTVRVRGEVTADEIAAHARRYLEEGPTSKVLWDYREAEGSGITANDLVRMQASLKDLPFSAKKRRLAVLVEHDLAYGLSRMAITYGELSEMPVDYFVTRSEEEAMDWLNRSA